MNTKQTLTAATLGLVGYYLLASLANYIFIGQEDIHKHFFHLPVDQVPGRMAGLVAIAILVISIALLRNRAGSWKTANQAIIKDTERAMTGKMIPEMLAHQLKTSLTTIMGFSKLMIKGTISEKSRTLYNHYIYSSSDNLLQTYRNLVEIQKQNGMQIHPKRDQCQIHKMLEEICYKYQVKNRESIHSSYQIGLTVPHDDQKPVLITDKERLQMILENLVQNAIDFSKEGSIEVGYEYQEAKTITFFVKDTGKTFSLDKFEEAYQNFLRNSKGIDSTFDLSALRTIVAKHNVELLGGKIWSASNKKRGTSYYFTLPMQIEKMPGKFLPNGDLIPDWSDKTILVAEDIETNFLLLKELLQPTGIHLIWAQNGKSAYDQFKKIGHQLDAALLDIIMPEMDGFEVASEIRKTNQNIPIIGQTAYSLENDQAFEKIANFNDFITKPIWFRDLVKTLQRHLK